MNKFSNDVKLFKALSDENRLKVLEILKDGEKCGSDLLSDLEISQPTLSHHMKILCDSTIVNYRKDGKQMIYTINENIKLKLTEILNNYL